MKHADPWTLTSITIISVSGLIAAVILFLWAPATAAVQTVASLFAFLGPIISVLLLVLRQQVEIEKGVNGTHAKLVEQAERLGRLEASAGIPPAAQPLPGKEPS